MKFDIKAHRPQRLRKSHNIRQLVQETTINTNDLIFPLFIIEGEHKKIPLKALPGHFQYTPDQLDDVLLKIEKKGLLGIMLFSVPTHKSDYPEDAAIASGFLQKTIQYIKKSYPHWVIIVDVCLCSYTSHGHCMLCDEDANINNDDTLPLLAKIACSYADAGADIVAPSGKADHVVTTLRKALDQQNHTKVSILHYAIKYASSFYGPFREASETNLSGDRKTYQMNPANTREALKEAELAAYEGADMIVVKPALPYLDIIHQSRQRLNIPIAAYQVSGEYAMIKAAVNAGLMPEQNAIMETLISIKRAGADIIITYAALEVEL